MTNAEQFCRLSTQVATGVCLLIAIVIWTIVLPPVKADTFVRATPDRAAIAFKVVLFLFDAANAYRAHGHILMQNTRDQRLIGETFALRSPF
jgi:hypothetical protein